MLRNSHTRVASLFTILTPRPANRQVLRKVCGVVRIWVGVSLVRECLVSLRASKTHLGFKGCMPVTSHARRTFSSIYEHFRAGSNIH